MQVFGIQADELWSFVEKKVKKRWIWVAYDPVHRLVIAHHIGGRGKKAALKQMIGRRIEVLFRPTGIKSVKT